MEWVVSLATFFGGPIRAHDNAMHAALSLPLRWPGKILLSVFLIEFVRLNVLSFN